MVAAGAAGEASGVNPATGVVLKDKVGSAPAFAVGNAKVGRGTRVSVGSGVGDGAASAVSVSCADNCPIAVATAAVLIALTSTVGTSVAPMLHPAMSRAAAIKARN